MGVQATFLSLFREEKYDLSLLASSFTNLWTFKYHLLALPRCKNLWTLSLFAAIVRVRVYCVDFFDFFVLRHSWVLQVPACTEVNPICCSLTFYSIIGRLLFWCLERRHSWGTQVVYSCLDLLLHRKVKLGILYWEHFNLSCLHRAKDRFVLISADGPHNNVLKIKPPMCFAKKDADHLCSVLDEILGEVEDSK